ncbi:hypothetical protein FGO68_gene10803 [Halteria grandinella]|uniref:Uncharacterized protein n=1 Tax=Halteria grandinella TaxID=5974 RepID=A0A8J8NE22_HALGN|nr:hypothetical protein FGO68_gene10803 [Halteria grandinella]
MINTSKRNLKSLRQSGTQVKQASMPSQKESLNKTMSLKRDSSLLGKIQSIQHKKNATTVTESTRSCQEAIISENHRLREELEKARAEIVRLHSLLQQVSSPQFSTCSFEQGVFSPANSYRDTPLLGQTNTHTDVSVLQCSQNFCTGNGSLGFEAHNHYLNVVLNNSAEISPSFGPKTYQIDHQNLTPVCSIPSQSPAEDILAQAKGYLMQRHIGLFTPETKAQTQEKSRTKSTPIPFLTSPSPLMNQFDPISERQSHSENVSSSSIIVYDVSDYSLGYEKCTPKSNQEHFPRFILDSERSKDIRINDEEIQRRTWQNNLQKIKQKDKVFKELAIDSCLDKTSDFFNIHVPSFQRTTEAFSNTQMIPQMNESPYLKQNPVNKFLGNKTSQNRGREQTKSFSGTRTQPIPLSRMKPNRPQHQSVCKPFHYPEVPYPISYEHVKSPSKGYFNIQL